MIDQRFYELVGPFSLSELISDLDVEPFLNEKIGDAEISSPADLGKAGRGQISFLSHKKFADEVATSNATACFTTERLAPLLSARSIVPVISKHPRAHFARIVKKLVRTRVSVSEPASVSKSAQIHETAIIGQGAVIEDGAYIGPYSIIGTGVRIGRNSRLQGHVTIECADIGKDCLIKYGAQIGAQGFGMDGDESGITELPHIGRAILGDRVHIGSQTCIDRGFLGDTVIGNDVKIDNLVQIGHNCEIGDGTMLAAHTGISGSCKVGRNVRMGGAVGLADHVNVGDGAQLAAAAGVMHDVPAGEVWSGVPAQPIRDHMRMIAATRKLIEKKTK